MGMMIMTEMMGMMGDDLVEEREWITIFSWMGSVVLSYNHIKVYQT